METRAEVLWAEENGAHAVVVLPPYYLCDIGTQGLVDYYGAALDGVQTPVILYNFPKHTGNELTVDVLRGVSHFGLKDSSAQLQLISVTPNYFVGGDRRISDALQGGAAGFVSGFANADPCLWVEMEAAWRAGKADAVAAGQASIDRVVSRLTGPQEIAAIKRGIGYVVPGYPDRVRPPLR